MTKATLDWITVGATLVLLVTIISVLGFAPLANNRFADGTAAIAFITGAAVAIERILELVWTFLGGLLGTYWPLNVINKQVDTLIEHLDNTIQPFYKQAEVAFSQLKGQEQFATAQIEPVLAEIKSLREQFETLRQLTPDNQRTQLLIATAAQHTQYLYGKYSNTLTGQGAAELEQAKQVIDTTIARLQDVLTTFKDNPGRRLISLYLGAVLGLGVAGVFGLDLFQAILGATPATPNLRIVVTGLIIGLGSNPTHEVIRVVQEYKKSQKSANISALSVQEQ